jgi:predicted chitinase
MLTLDILRKLAPTLPADKAALYLPYINQAMTENGIVTKLRVAGFIAQILHESCELRFMEELASGIHYEGRKDLGNIYPGDGERFKGRGPIQLTGRHNYHLAGDAIGLNLEAHPDLAKAPEVGFRVAGWFWNCHKLNSYCDKADFEGLTRKINGGLNGLSSRLKYYNLALKLLG